MEKPKLVISFSGGETSGFMTQWLMNNKKDEYDIVCIFANTGQENEETLEFVEKCDKAFNMNLVWIEAVVHNEHGKGVTHKIVNFETANRNGRIYENVIAKYGIPNIRKPHCTQYLKTIPMKSYFRSIGWKKYYTAIGIRVDEIDRVNKDRIKNRLYYPLVTDMPMTKQKINFWWKNQPFRLELKGYQGNCKWCFKKSLNKLLTLCVENPEHFDFPRSMEQKYEDYTPENGTPNGNKWRFFRDNQSVDELFELSKLPFTKSLNDASVYSWQTSILDVDHLDISNGCEESCEVY